jgi:hypothetical protein
VLLAPELAPGRVEGPGPSAGSGAFAGGTVGLVLGEGIPPERPPPPPPAPGVVGVVLGLAVLGVVGLVVLPGVAVLGAVPGVTVLGVVPGATVPGATVSVVVSGLVVVVPCGGPESGARIGGILVVLDGSLGLVGAAVGLDSIGPACWLTSGLSGVRSFAPGAFGPNGLRPSIGPFCASVAPVHVIRSYEARSAIRTSAGADRSAASASSTTTGCKNSMAHPPYEMLL